MNRVPDMPNTPRSKCSRLHCFGNMKVGICILAAMTRLGSAGEDWPHRPLVKNE